MSQLSRSFDNHFTRFRFYASEDRHMHLFRLMGRHLRLDVVSKAAETGALGGRPSQANRIPASE